MIFMLIVLRTSGRSVYRGEKNPHKIDVLVADVFVTLSGRYRWPLARNFIICTGTILACDKERRCRVAVYACICA